MKHVDVDLFGQLADSSLDLPIHLEMDDDAGWRELVAGLNNVVITSPGVCALVEDDGVTRHPWIMVIVDGVSCVGGDIALRDGSQVLLGSAISGG